MSTGIDVISAIHKLTALSEVLQRTYDEWVREWMPDAPPTTLILSDMGRAIGLHKGQLSRGEMQSIWELVEELLITGNDEVQNAVATGFV